MQFFEKEILTIANFDRIAYIFMLILTFGLPWSGALFRIGLFGFIFFGLSSILGKFSPKKIPYSNPIKFGYFLFIWIIIGAIYSPAPQYLIQHDISHYRKLTLILPFVIFLRTNNRRINIIYALLAGTIFLMIPTFYDAFDINKIFPFDFSFMQSIHYQSKESGKIENLVYIRDHIVHGYFVCILLAASMTFSIYRKKYRYAYIFLAVVCTFDLLFLIRGRAALLCALFLFPLIALKTLQTTKSKIGIILALIAASFTLTFIPHIHQRISSIATETASYASTSTLVTSAGTRIHYWTISKNIFIQHPLIGGGLGSFRNTLVTQNDPLLGSNHFHAHNEFITLASQNGILGLLIFLGFIGTLVKACMDSKNNEINLFGFLFIFIFCFNALTDSSLFNELEGWTFVMLAAVIASERCFPALARVDTP